MEVDVVDCEVEAGCDCGLHLLDGTNLEER